MCCDGRTVKLYVLLHGPQYRLQGLPQICDAQLAELWCSPHAVFEHGHEHGNVSLTIHLDRHRERDFSGRGRGEEIFYGELGEGL